MKVRLASRIKYHHVHPSTIKYDSREQPEAWMSRTSSRGISANLFQNKSSDYAWQSHGSSMSDKTIITVSYILSCTRMFLVTFEFSFDMAYVQTSKDSTTLSNGLFSSTDISLLWQSRRYPGIRSRGQCLPQGRLKGVESSTQIPD